MTEISKMFENAGVEKIKDYYCPNCETKLEDWFGKHKEYICPNERCDYALCDDEEDFQECLENLSYREKYPSFTAEKQLELIKWLGKTYELSINWEEQYNSYRFVIRNYKNGRLSRSICNYKGLFEETLVYLINRIWQDLTDQEKEEIRNILNA